MKKIALLFLVTLFSTPHSSFAQFKGSLECSNCHVAPQTKNLIDGVTDFVALNEYKIWLNQDPHSRAYLNIIPEPGHFNAVRDRLMELNAAVNQAKSAVPIESEPVRIPTWSASNDLSRDMLRKMFAAEYGEKVESLFQELTVVQQRQGKHLEHDDIAIFLPKLKATMQQCMSCHAGWDKRQTEFDLEIVKYGTGVSCEACHGGSAEWLKPHTETEWRKRDPRSKEKDFGQHDVRNSMARSELCFSCHIGNAEQGKMVTHEMYAAGHPPLPSIEIESFADQMPRHWRHLSEKPDFKFASEFKQFYGFDLRTNQSIAWSEEEFPRTKNLLVGGVMASSHSIRLLAEAARNHSPSETAKGEELESNRHSASWPEFAAFDCAACHHDLKVQGRERGFAGIPGRPPAPYWPRVIAKLGLGFAEVQQRQDYTAEFAKRQSAFQAVLDRQPFGVPTELDSVGTDYARWLKEEVANQIASHSLTRADAISVLELLCGANGNSVFQPEAETWDFHSARQLAWAINQVYSELAQHGLRGERIPHSNFVVAQPGTEFGKILLELQAPLMLKLPTNGEITNEQVKYLSAWQKFDRKQFFEQLTALRTAIKIDPLINQSLAPSNQPGPKRSP